MHAYAKRLILLMSVSWQETRDKSFCLRLLAVARVLTSIFYRHGCFVVIAFPLTSSIKQHTTGIKVKKLTTLEETPESLIKDLVDRERFGNFLSSGEMGFLVELRGENVGYCWASPVIDRNIHRVDLPLEEGDVFIHDVFVLSEFRRQGIATAMLSDVLSFLKSQGYRRALSHVRLDNEGALRVYRHLGYVDVAHLTHQRLLWMDHFRYVPVVKKVY